MSERSVQSGAPKDVGHDALRAMAGAVAHDLNNILTAIAGNLSLLQEVDAEDDGWRGEYFNAVQKSVERGIRLSEKMEAIAGRLLLRPEPVNVNKLVRDVLGTLPRAVLDTVEVRSFLSPNNPIVMADSEKLLTAVEGLTASAACAAVEDRGALEISTDLDRDADKFVRIRAVFAGAPRFAEAIEIAFTSPYSTPVCLSRDKWNLAGVTGFVKQSQGSITLRRDTEHAAHLDILLPRWAPSSE